MELQLRNSIQELFELATKKATTFCTKCFARVSKHYNIVYVWKSHLSKYLLAEFVQEHRNVRLTGI